MLITINEPVQRLFEHFRVRTGWAGRDRWAVGSTVRLEPRAAIEPFCHIFDSSLLPAQFGAFSYSYSRLSTGSLVGRYTSIAKGVEIMGSSHPAAWASTSPALYEPGAIAGIEDYFRVVKAERRPETFEQPKPSGVRIGNDVWIGADVILGRAISIGDGSIIAAGSVVTKDVPPYAIVGGVPARIIRMRFDAATVERMRAAEWWRFGPEVLQDLDVKLPEQFLDRLEAAIEKGAISPRIFKRLNGSDVIKAATGPLPTSED